MCYFQKRMKRLFDCLLVSGLSALLAHDLFEKRSTTSIAIGFLVFFMVNGINEQIEKLTDRVSELEKLLKSPEEKAGSSDSTTK